MPLKLEIGKKYLDQNGNEWEVTRYVAQNIFMIEREDTAFTVFGDGTCGTPGFSLVSEVPSPATTTPQETTKFKVGDRVRVVTDDEGFEGATGVVDEFSDTGEIGVAFDERQIDGSSAAWFYAWELEHLTDTPTTPSLVQCSCPTVVLMRDGCTCGNARKEIEQEFKREGWG